MEHTDSDRRWRYADFNQVVGMVRTVEGIPVSAVEPLAVAHFLCARKPPTFSRIWGDFWNQAMTLLQWTSNHGGPDILEPILQLYDSIEDPLTFFSTDGITGRAIKGTRVAVPWEAVLRPDMSITLRSNRRQRKSKRGPSAQGEQLSLQPAPGKENFITLAHRVLTEAGLNSTVPSQAVHRRRSRTKVTTPSGLPVINALLERLWGTEGDEDSVARQTRSRKSSTRMGSDLKEVTPLLLKLVPHVRSRRTWVVIGNHR